MTNKETKDSKNTDRQDEATVIEEAVPTAAHPDAEPDVLETEVATEEVDYPALIAQLEADLVEARAQLADVTDQYQRMAAEFQNSRRRQEKQLHDEIERASAHLLRRLLPVADDLDLAFANVPPDLDVEASWVDGFRQIQRKLRNLVEEEGVTIIETADEFDPSLHEAISSEPSEEVPSGHIIETLRVGYLYKGRVLRPALVRVAL